MFFFFKQKTAYEMRISDWSSDVCSSDLLDDYRADGSLSMADWLTYRHRVSRTTARRWVKAANALEDLPLIRARFVAGELSFEQVRHALIFAKPADDAELAELLPSLSCTEIADRKRTRLNSSP